MLRYINPGLCTARDDGLRAGLKYFILLHFDTLRRCAQRLLVQCTKISLTGRGALPRMKLLRRTISSIPRAGASRPRRPHRYEEFSMSVTANPFSEMSRAGLEAATRLTRISMDNAERVISLQLQYAKGTIEQATATAKAASAAKDVQELFDVRTRSAENAVEWLMNYSRSAYEVASETQSELSKLAEERMTSFQQAVTESVEQAAKASPGGNDLAVAAIKSSLAATTAAFDSFAKAAKNVTTYTDAGIRAGTKTRK
jgi:phasin family protein